MWLQEHFTWVTFAGCALHDFHNGYKKGMHGYLRDRQFMAGLYGGVASLRDSFSSIITGIGLWLPTVVSFSDSAWAQEEQYRFYNLFGLTPPIVEALMALQLRYDGTHLCIAARFRDHPESAQLVTTLLLALWQFREWTDSRWLSMGKTSRTMAIAMSTGL